MSPDNIRLRDVIVDGINDGVIGATLVEHKMSRPLNTSIWEKAKYRADPNPDGDGIVKFGFQTSRSELKYDDFLEYVSKYTFFRKN